jgi:predicted phosphate transport protein (TIGR00153 family)
VRWFLPKDEGFLAIFDQATQNIVEAVKLFCQLLEDGGDRPGQVEQLKALEHQGDRYTHQTLAKLNTSFITPFDREDIHALATKLDDILDAVDATGHRLLLYGVASVPARLKELAQLLLASAEEVQKAVLLLHDPRRQEEALQRCVEINRLENEADQLHRQALADLFAHATDAVEVIKLKDLYAFLEEATDRCEDVANIVETIVIKAS